MKPVLSLVVVLFASAAVACPPVAIEQPVQVQSFGHVQQFGAVTTFASPQFVIVQDAPRVERFEFVGLRSACARGANVRFLEVQPRRQIVRQRSVVRVR